MSYRQLAGQHWDCAASALEDARKAPPGAPARRGAGARGVWHVQAVRILCDAGHLEYPPGCDDVLEELRAHANAPVRPGPAPACEARSDA